MTTKIDSVKNLLPASYNGYNFKVRGGEVTFGRRTVLHEFPFSNKSYVEDVGKKAKTVSFDAYTIGDNTVAERNVLMDELEKKKEGSLIHPSLGHIYVKAQECSHIYRDDKLRIDYFRLTFTETGNSPFVELYTDTQQTVVDSVTELLTEDSKVSKEFEERFETETSFLQKIAKFDLTEFIDKAVNSTSFGKTVTDGYNSFMSTVEDFRDGIDNIVKQTNDLRVSVMTVVDDLQGVLNTPLETYNALKSVLDFDINFNLKFPLPEDENKWTPNRVQQDSNRKALQNLVKSTVIAEVAKTVTEMTFESKNDALEIRDDLDAVFETQLDILGNDTDATSYEEITLLRSYFIKDINKRVGTLPEIKTITMYDNLPAINIAYNEFEDSERESEIVEMNSVRNPLFVQRGNIEVLSA